MPMKHPESHTLGILAPDATGEGMRKTLAKAEMAMRMGHTVTITPSPFHTGNWNVEAVDQQGALLRCPEHPENTSRNPLQRCYIGDEEGDGHPMMAEEK